MAADFVENRKGVHVMNPVRAIEGAPNHAK